jgi:hypothetical protein
MKKILILCSLGLTGGYLPAQNIGLGTAIPLMKLHVAKADSAVALLENTQTLGAGVNTALYFKTGNAGFPYTGAVKTIGEGPAAARLGFFTYTSTSPNQLLERLSITDVGNIGINNTQPQTNLHINPNGAGSLLIGSNKYSGGFTNIEMGINTQSNGYGYIQAVKASGSSYGYLNLNPNGGRIGLNTTTPQAALDVNGGIALPIKTIMTNYTVQDADYTVVVNMQNDTNKIVNIYLPPHFVNEGRIIKIVPLNMAVSNGFNSYFPNTVRNLINIYDASGTVLYKTIYNRFYQHLYSENAYGTNLHHNDFREERITAITLQCIAAGGWLITDLDEFRDQWGYTD